MQGSRGGAPCFRRGIPLAGPWSPRSGSSFSSRPTSACRPAGPSGSCQRFFKKLEGALADASPGTCWDPCLLFPPASVSGRASSRRLSVDLRAQSSFGSAGFCVHGLQPHRDQQIRERRNLLNARRRSFLIIIL